MYISEIVAYLIWQSRPFLDKLGTWRDMECYVVFALSIANHFILTNVMQICAKLVVMLYSNRIGELLYHSSPKDSLS